MTVAAEALEPRLIHADEGERYTLGGSEVVFKNPLPGASSEWTIIEYTLEPHRPGALPHYHRELTETFYVLEGELCMRVGDQEMTATAGSLAVVAPGTTHGFRNDTDTPARFLLHASGPQHKSFLLELFELVRTSPVWPPADPTAMKRLGERYDTYYL